MCSCNACQLVKGTFLIEFLVLLYWKIQQLDDRSVRTTSGGRGQSGPLECSARTSVAADSGISRSWHQVIHLRHRLGVGKEKGKSG